ncbi:MAG TPA: DUF2243 domain-containing protein, partial [Candidatus Synoicihabitans sp.]|nr:DUF2243 domain-containing protein [Candidatus Synoicihabitans sp.]
VTHERGRKLLQLLVVAGAFAMPVADSRTLRFGTSGRRLYGKNGTASSPAALGLVQPITRAGIVLGLGLGGFADGIVLHQILGWHHLVCTTATCQPETIAMLQRQNTQDGYFHLAVWVVTLLGVALLFRALRRNATVVTGLGLSGATLAGWGIFNLVEGVINHHWLRIHHVRPGHPHEAMYDVLFLTFGSLLVIGGAMLVQRGRHWRPYHRRGRARSMTA